MSPRGVEKFIAKLISYLSQTSGREKILRLVQYFCRFLVTKYTEQYQIMISQRNTILSKKTKAESLMVANAMARKVLRFGTSMNMVLTVIQNLKRIINGNYGEPLHLLVLKTLSAFFVGVFFICDHYLWLVKMDLIKDGPMKTKMEYWSAMGWFLDCITCLIKNYCMLSDERNDKIALSIDTVRVACDLVVSYSFVKVGSVNGKTVGLLGTLTSLIGIYQLWK